MTGYWVFVSLVLLPLFYWFFFSEESKENIKDNDSEEKSILEKIYDPSESEYWTLGPGSDDLDNHSYDNDYMDYDNN